MAAAAQAYGQVLEYDPTHSGAIAGLAQAHLPPAILIRLNKCSPWRRKIQPIRKSPPRADLALAANPMRLAMTQAPSWARWRGSNNHQARFDLALVYLWGR